MRRSIVLSMATVLFAFPLCVSLGEAEAQTLPRYQITELGTLGGDSTMAAAINASGQVTGTAKTFEGYSRAFLWDGAYLQDIGTLSGDNSWGNDINDLGQVTGVSERDDADCSWEEIGQYMGCHPRAFIWSDGEMIGHPRAAGYSVGRKINSFGQVLAWFGDDPNFNTFVWDGATTSDVGGSPYRLYSVPGSLNDSGQATGTIIGYFGYEPARAFIWDAALGELHVLGPYFGLNTTTWGIDINAAGQVAGDVLTWPHDCNYDNPWLLPPYCHGGRTWYSGEDHYRAFLWSGSSAVQLGTLGGTNSFSVALNDSGQVVGSSQTAGDSAWHAFIWSNDVMYDLGTLGGTESQPVAVNNAGLVTGFATTEGNSQVRAFVWDGLFMHDLNQLIADSIPDRPLLWQGEDINDAGQILASGYSSSGKDRAYVLTPISLLFSRLLDDSIGVGPGKTLERRVENAITYYDAEDLGATCSTLEGYVSQVDGLASKRNPKISPAEAQKLIGEAYAIHAALACP